MPTSMGLCPCGSHSIGTAVAARIITMNGSLSVILSTERLLLLETNPSGCVTGWHLLGAFDRPGTRSAECSELALQRTGAIQNRLVWPTGHSIPFFWHGVG